MNAPWQPRSTHYIIMGLLALCGLLCSTVYANAPLRFKALVSEQLDTVGIVADVVQDPQGFMWFGCM